MPADVTCRAVVMSWSRCDGVGSMADNAADDLTSDIDVSKPHPARMYDYYIGGKNHFAADRAVADRALASWPAGRIGLRENRRFLGRVVRFLAAEAGIRQFLDIGSGLPTTNNVHEVAQAVDPSSRVVYVDNDSMVLAHARALLASAPEGRTAYIQADLRVAARHPDVAGDPVGARLQQAGRADARRGAALPARRRTSRRRSLHAARRAAVRVPTWPPRT